MLTWNRWAMFFFWSFTLARWTALHERVKNDMTEKMPKKSHERILGNSKSCMYMRGGNGNKLLIYFYGSLMSRILLLLFLLLFYFIRDFQGCPKICVTWILLCVSISIAMLYSLLFFFFFCGKGIVAWLSKLIKWFFLSSTQQKKTHFLMTNSFIAVFSILFIFFNSNTLCTRRRTQQKDEIVGMGIVFLLKNFQFGLRFPYHNLIIAFKR